MANFNIPNPYEIDKFMIKLLHLTSRGVSPGEKLMRLDCLMDRFVLTKEEDSEKKKSTQNVKKPKNGSIDTLNESFDSLEAR